MDEEKEGGAKIRKEGLTWTIRKEGRQEGSKKECRGSESGRVGGRGEEGWKEGREEGRTRGKRSAARQPSRGHRKGLAGHLGAAGGERPVVPEPRGVEVPGNTDDPDVSLPRQPFSRSSSGLPAGNWISREKSAKARSISWGLVSRSQRPLVP